MKKYTVQPLDLMQYINTKYHDPFIHELIEFEDGLDTERLLGAIIKLADAFPLLKCHYDSESNSYVENDAFSARDLLRIDDTCDRNMLLTEALNLGEKLIHSVYAFGKSSCYHDKPFDYRRYGFQAADIPSV